MLVVDKNTGNVLDTFTSPDFSDLELFDVALAPDNTFYVLGDLNAYTGVIVHMNLQGQTLGEFTMPVTDAAGFARPRALASTRTTAASGCPGQQRHARACDSSGDSSSDVFDRLEPR